MSIFLLIFLRLTSMSHISPNNRVLHFNYALGLCLLGSFSFREEKYQIFSSISPLVHEIS